MMSKTFNSALAKRVGRDKKDTEALLEALARSVRQHCAELDYVAIPGFGKFIPEKHNEKIVIDRVEGKRLLLPPEVIVTFRAGTKLRNQIEQQANTETTTIATDEKYGDN
jgi:nucleoid DNA-binding protein